MTERNAWRQAFPAETRSKVIAELLNTWAEGCRGYPTKYASSRKEPELTENLWMLLKQLQADSGLSGQWSYEFHSAKEDKNGKVTRIRKDITYFSNRLEDANPGPLNLVFEFKKISGDSLSSYTNDHGMGRFVDGNYAEKLPFALMVGMVTGDKNATIDKLKTSLNKDRNVKKLRMVVDEKGLAVRPSQDIPQHFVEFETEHGRPAELAPPGGTIILGHCFIEFP